jgi:hypothetical protein
VPSTNLELRVARAAEAALAEQKYVAPIDVLLGVGWLQPAWMDRWQQGRVDYLEHAVQAGPGNVSSAMRVFRRWAEDRGLKPSETEYLARSRERQRLRFSESGDPSIERAYRTHWISPALSGRKAAGLTERQSEPPDLVVISPIKDWTCSSCGGTGDLLMMEGGAPVCMTCAEMDHLAFLPSGDAALTRRAKRASRLSAVVVRFSRARKRYERQGVLVEEEALEQAEQECLADEQLRARRRQRDAVRRGEQDVELQAQMATSIAQLFPGCPGERTREIARHAATRGSGRVGRSAAGRALEPGALELAVAASVRHRDTPYDDLLMSGAGRHDARDRVRDEVARIMAAWRRS